ncbi:MAG: hypothetical protein M9959_04540 [Chitinophagaceae bacterium]|jgi:formate/nitrite transporter FocA (FNT family)|nr:hypothetical protein [Chitinophagaceae bacterium]HRN49040.1 hypothetical protein [Niabella sp.]
MTDKKISSRPIWILVSIFLILNILGLSFRSFLTGHQIDLNAVLTANLILLLLSVYTMQKTLKSFSNPNPHAFLRNFYAGFLVRIAVIAAAAFLYIYSKDGIVDRATLFICLGIYALYSIAEVSVLRKILFKKNNA